MNGKDRKYWDERLEKLEGKMQLVHDDVLILKTQRDTAAKFMYAIAGGISLITSLLVRTFWR